MYCGGCVDVHVLVLSLCVCVCSTVSLLGFGTAPFHGADEAAGSWEQLQCHEGGGETFPSRNNGFAPDTHHHCPDSEGQRCRELTCLTSLSSHRRLLHTRESAGKNKWINTIKQSLTSSQISAECIRVTRGNEINKFQAFNQDKFTSYWNLTYHLMWVNRCPFSG